MMRLVIKAFISLAILNRFVLSVVDSQQNDEEAQKRQSPTFLFSESDEVVEILQEEQLNNTLSSLMRVEGRNETIENVGLPERTPFLAVGMFYATFCPHCHHYAPHFREFAAIFARCGSQVPFFAFECVVSSLRRSECRRYGVMGFPSVLVFWREGEEQILRYKRIPSSSRNPAEAIKWMKQNLPFPLLISVCAGELAPQMSDISVSLNPPSQERQEENKIDSLRRVDRNASVQRDEEKLVMRWKIDRESQASPSDRLHDALLAFQFLLHCAFDFEIAEEVSMMDKVLVLSRFARVASQTLPGSNIRREFEHLANTLAISGDPEGSNGGNLTALVQQFSPGYVHFLGGQTVVQGQFRFCTTLYCGVWALFHILSNGLHVYKEEVEDCIGAYQAQTIIRDFIDQFVTCDYCRSHFLHSFDHCAFDRCRWILDGKRDYEDYLDKKIPSVIQNNSIGLVMWLWRIHNVVTVRQAVWTTWKNESGNCTTGECVTYKGLDVRYPPSELCSTCRREDDQEVIQEGVGPSSGPVEVDSISSFNLTNVLRFLQTVYWDNAAWIFPSELWWKLNDFQVIFVADPSLRSDGNETHRNLIRGSKKVDLYPNNSSLSSSVVNLATLFVNMAASRCFVGISSGLFLLLIVVLMYRKKELSRDRRKD